MAAIFAGPSDNRWGPEEWGGHPEVSKRTTLLVAGGKAPSGTEAEELGIRILGPRTSPPSSPTASSPTDNRAVHYAKTLAVTAEREFLRYKKVTADGRTAGLGPSDLYDLLHLDQRADRVLPNGWCMLPPKKALHASFRPGCG
ncbi:hypothetical protein [Streptomyces sp. NPDC029721]|uniref:hypothetical protein n=1 Tax=Streptomyces sp. NPDC029721 TaxID=3157090 RepID=UPI00340753CB